jgi:PAS domain-containing protein
LLNVFGTRSSVPLVPDAPTRSLGRASRLCGAGAVAVGALVITGWSFGIAPLLQVLPGQVAMVPSTAVAFLFAGFALWLRPPPGGSRLRAARIAAAIVTGLLGVANLLEFFSGRNLGIDEILFRDTGGLTSTSPGRMAVSTGVSFVLLAAALLTLERHSKSWASDILAMVPGFVGLLSLTGYAYGLGSLHWFGQYKGMAIHAALAFPVLSIGVLLAREGGFLRLAASDTVGGDIVRKIVPLALFLPLALGWLRIAGKRAGYWSDELGTSLNAIAHAAAFLVLLLVAAARIMRTEEERRRAAAQLERQSGILQSMLESVSEGIVVVDAEGSVLVVNPVAEHLLHLGPDPTPIGRWPERVGAVRWDGTPLPPEETAIARALRGLATDHLDLLVRPVDSQEWRRLEVSGRPILGPDGTILGGVTIFRDVTEQKTTEGVLRLRERAIDAVTQGVLMTDFTRPGNPIIHVNPAFERNTGYAASEVIGKRPNLFQGPGTDPEARRRRRNRPASGVTAFSSRRTALPRTPASASGRTSRDTGRSPRLRASSTAPCGCPRCSSRPPARRGRRRGSGTPARRARSPPWSR